MKTRIKQKTYSGQALAIAMLVLVVSSLIGLSMFSRTRRDRALTLEERSSAEALEVSDIILDNITNFKPEEIVEAINNTYYSDTLDEFDEEEGVVLYENTENDNISRLFEELGIFHSNISLSNLVSPLCPIEIQPNEYQLTIRKADRDTVYELRPGHVWSFPTRNVIITNPQPGSVCNLNIYISEIGDSLAGFTESRIYCEYDNDIPTQCIDYDNYDNVNNQKMKKYMFAFDGEDHPSFYTEDSDNWIQVTPSNTTPAISLNLIDGTTSIPSELRIKSLGRIGSPGIGISYELEGNFCPKGVNMYQVRATANCSEIYRGKEIIIPHRGYSAIFDYIYFSGM